MFKAKVEKLAVSSLPQCCNKTVVESEVGCSDKYF